MYLYIRLSDKEKVSIFYFFNQVIISINKVVDKGGGVLISQ